MLKTIFSQDLRKSFFIAWGIALLITIIVLVITGQIYGAAEAKQLLQSVQKSSLYYGSALIASSSTILALMLTILSLTHNNHEDPSKSVFLKLKTVASLCVFTFIGALVLLLIISFPVLEFEKIPAHWFEFVYYAFCVWNGILAGLMLSVILILKETTLNLIGYLSPDFDEDGEET